jgi:ribosomal protein S17E
MTSKRQGLSDKELIEKYKDLRTSDFNKALEKATDVKKRVVPSKTSPRITPKKGK